jgi:hypothetical protein
MDERKPHAARKEGESVMKKFTTLMLGLSLVLGTASLFAQDTKEPTKTEKKKKGGKKKKGEKKQEETK